MSKIFVTFFIFFILLCSCQEKAQPSIEEQQALVQEFQRGPLHIVITISPEKPTIADRITVDIVIDVDPVYSVVFPEFGEQIGQVFFIYDYYKTPVEIKNKRKIYKSSYEIEALISGNTILPALTFQYQKGEVVEESAYRAETDPIAIDIQSFALENEEMNDIYDIQNNMELPSSLQRYIIVSVVLFCILCIFILFKIFYKTKQQEHVFVDTRTAEEIAWEKLKELMEKQWIEQKQYQSFYFELTMIVRQYIESKYKLNAPGQTTEEFLQNISNASFFSMEQKNNFVRFLEATDFVKYAAQEPEAKEVEMVFQTAKIFMNLDTSS